MKFVKKYKGFSLIEMMVSIAIFGIISGIVVWNSSKFSGNLLVTNLAYEVALAVRQAQVYGLSVKGSDSTNFNIGYGVHFDSTNNKNFYFFVDLNNDGKCEDPGLNNCSNSTEVREVHSIANNNYISKLCVVGSISGGSEIHCSTDTPYLNSVDITFKRPDPNSIIKVYDPSGSEMSSLYPISEAQIFLKSPQGKAKYVGVLSTGQISIKDDNQ